MITSVVAVAEQLEHKIQLRARRLRAARVIDVSVLGRHPGPAQRVDLMIRVQIRGGHPRVAEQHASTIPRPPWFSTSRADVFTLNNGYS